MPPTEQPREKGRKRLKISILGIGRVGSTIAFTIVQKGIADEMVLVNRTHAIAVGEAQDLVHASAFTSQPMRIRAGRLEDTAGSDIVVLCISVPFTKEMRTRADLLAGNRPLFENLAPEIASLSPDAILVVVTNPVDAMTYFALRYSQLPPERVLGVGTLVDSARYRALLSKEFKIHPDDIRAYILGEHGDRQFPALSLAMIGGVSIEKAEAAQRLFEETVSSGYEVVRHKGYTNHAIAMATSLILESIVSNWHRTIPVSTLISGYCGVDDVCLSVPAVIGREGILRQLKPPLNNREQQAFRDSAQAVREMIDEVSK